MWHWVQVRSVPVAMTHWCLTSPPSFVFPNVTLTAATAPVTLPTSAHIWAPVLLHAVLRTPKLVSFVRLSGSVLLCSLKTHQVCTTDAKIETDATAIENTT